MRLGLHCKWGCAALGNGQAVADGDGVAGISSAGVCGAGRRRHGRAVWVWAAGMDGEEQGAGKIEGRGTGVRDVAEACGVG